MQVVLLPGLGYDHRIFKNLTLTGLDTTYLDWIEPQPNESLHEYAKRLYSNISTGNSEKTMLIGHSLGGIVAQEIASFRHIDYVILISTIISEDELPATFRWIRWLRLYRLFTKELSINTIRSWGNSHGFTTTEDIELFKSMLTQQSNAYLQWALRSLTTWSPPVMSEYTKIVRIHGTNDKTFPVNLIKDPTHIIEKGSHIMVYKQADKMTDIIMNEIRKDFE